MRQALSVLATVAIVALATPARATPTEDLDRGRNLFQQRDWQAASKELTALLYPTLRLADKDKTVEAHVLFGACELELGDTQTAHDEFEKALELDSEKSLNALSFSEGAIKLFDDVKVELKVRNERADERRKAAEANARLQEYLKNLVVVEAHPFALNFVPFGIGQLQNNQNRKAVLFAVGEVATAGTSIAIFGYLVNTYGISGTVDPKFHDPHTVRLLQQIEIGTGVAFFGLYIYGVIDANLHYQRQTRLQSDPTLLPPALRDLDNPAPAPLTTKPPPKQTSFHLGPILVPSGAGLGLAWER